MKRSWLISLAAAMSALGLVASRSLAAADGISIDLTQWNPPDITTVADDPFGRLVKYGHALFTDTANEIGPGVSDPTSRFAGNNLACQNCHLQAGRQPYAMPLTGVWGQFPQYRAREGAVDTLEERINGCMERSMNGRALPLDSLEMRAFSSYVRWLSTGIPDGAKLVECWHVENSSPCSRCRSWSWRADFFRDMRRLPWLGWTRTARPKWRGVSVSTALGS